MTSMEAEYFTGLDATYSQNKGHGYRGNKKNRGDMVPIGTMYGVNPPHTSTPVASWTKDGSRILLSKIDGNGCLKIFA